jgi:hypothetical protein
LAKSFAALAGNLWVLAGVLAGMVQPVQSEFCKGDCKGADEATKTKTTQGFGIRKNQFNFVSNNTLQNPLRLSEQTLR